MSNKPNYTITPERFARARADIERRRTQLIESHAAATAVIAGHAAAVAVIDSELGEVDACEEAAANFAARYPEDAATPPTTRGRKTKRPNTGRPYKPKDNERIVAAERGTLEALAATLGRDYPGVLKQHEMLLKQQRESENTEPRPLVFIPADGPPPPAPEMQTEEDPINLIEQLGHPEKSGSENSPIVEPAAAPETVPPPNLAAATKPFKMIDDEERRLTRPPPPKPGRPVPGCIDNGPEDRRYIDPIYDASRGSR